MQKSSFLCLCYILRAIMAGRCRERRYADHMFIQIYFRMHHFVVNYFKIFFASGGKGALSPLTIKSKFPQCFCRHCSGDGVADCAVIATNFAKHFESVCKSVKTHNEALKTKYNALRAHYCGSVLTDEQVFDAELLVGKLIVSSVAKQLVWTS